MLYVISSITNFSNAYTVTMVMSAYTILAGAGRGRGREGEREGEKEKRGHYLIIEVRLNMYMYMYVARKCYLIRVPSRMHVHVHTQVDRPTRSLMEQTLASPTFAVLHSNHNKYLEHLDDHFGTLEVIIWNMGVLQISGGRIRLGHSC